MLGCRPGVGSMLGWMEVKWRSSQNLSLPGHGSMAFGTLEDMSTTWGAPCLTPLLVEDVHLHRQVAAVSCHSPSGGVLTCL